MAINWDQLGNKLNQLLHNYAEFGRKYYDFFAAPPKDIPLEFYDENGNLINRNIPNVAKLRDRFISDVNSVMAKTVYVDAENGSDETGDGSSSAPFKTLEKAINSVPEGGHGHIVIRGDHTIKSVIIRNKVIIIDTDGEASIKPEIYTRDAGGTTYYEYMGFILMSNASLIINIYNSNNLRFKMFVEDIDDSHPITPDSGFIVVSEGETSASCHIYIRTVVNNRNPIYIGRRAVLFSISEWAVDRPAHVSFSLSGHYEGENRHIIIDGDLANLKASPASLYVSYRGGFKDSAGNSIDIKTKIKGIVKDSNGTPRNVISNIIF